MVSLARLTGAAILPLFCIDENGGRVQLIIEPAIHFQTETDREHYLEQTVRRYADLLEKYKKTYPEQYRRRDFSEDEA